MHLYNVRPRRSILPYVSQQWSIEIYRGPTSLGECPYTGYKGTLRSVKEDGKGSYQWQLG